MLVKDINPGSASSDPTALTGINGALYFSADDGRHGAELRISDGTGTGTVLALDIDPGPAAAIPDRFTRLSPTTGSRGAIVFRALYETAGPGLWAVPLLDSIVTPIVCPGDCNGNERVTVDELVTGVGTALGTSTLSCTAMDGNSKGRVTGMRASIWACTGTGAARQAHVTARQAALGSRVIEPLSMGKRQSGPGQACEGYTAG